MTIPIAIGVVVGAVGAIIRAVVVLSRTYIAIIGERGVGKTTMINFLKQEGKESLHPKSTSTSENMGDINYGKYSFTKVIDLSGGENRIDWQKEVEKANIIFYLFNFNNIESNKRIDKDIKEISNWIKKDKKNVVFMIGTHYDKKFEIKDHDMVMNRLELNLCHLGGTDNVGLILGTLKTEEGFKDIFKKVDEKIDNG